MRLHAVHGWYTALAKNTLEKKSNFVNGERALTPILVSIFTHCSVLTDWAGRALGQDLVSACQCTMKIQADTTRMFSRGPFYFSWWQQEPYYIWIGWDLKNTTKLLILALKCISTWFIKVFHSAVHVLCPPPCSGTGPRILQGPGHQSAPVVWAGIVMGSLNYIL